MKNICYLLLFVSQVFWGQAAFEQGNQYYQKGNYQKAIASYESILKTGEHSADLYFNLGNSYYKLNQVAPAIFNFEKALLLKPNDKEIISNLSFAQKMTIDEVVEVPKVGFSRIIQDVTAFFHYDTWAWLTISLSLLFLGCFLGYYFSDKVLLKRFFFTTMIFLVLFMIISFLAGFFQRDISNNERPAIVFLDVASVKSEPKSNAPNAFVLHAGTKVFVLDTFENFKKVQLLDLKNGWIEASAIKELK